ncbi:hypothetical protein V8B97DRAFT_1914457 [Scleroderma yunnanense]
MIGTVILNLILERPWQLDETEGSYHAGLNLSWKWKLHESQQHVEREEETLSIVLSEPLIRDSLDDNDTSCLLEDAKDKHLRVRCELEPRDIIKAESHAEWTGEEQGLQSLSQLATLDIDHLVAKGICPKFSICNIGMVSSCLLWASNNVVKTHDEVLEGKHLDCERLLFEMAGNITVAHLVCNASVEPILQAVHMIILLCLGVSKYLFNLLLFKPKSGGFL